MFRPFAAVWGVLAIVWTGIFIDWIRNRRRHRKS